MSSQSKRFYEFGAFRLDPKERILLRQGEPVPLTPKVFDTLLALVESSGQLIEKDELMNKVWPDAIVEERGLTQNIFLLRKALGEDGADAKYIETVPKRGYRFVAEVRECGNGQADVIVQRRISAHIITEEEEETTAEDQAIERALDQKVLSASDNEANLRNWKPSRIAVAVTLSLAVLVLGLYFTNFKAWISSNTGHHQTGIAIKSIAVLPFKLIGDDADDEHLSLAMADALTTRLGSIGQVIVRPTSAVRNYNSPDQDPIAAGRELRVDSVLEGSIQRVGDRIRVTARLVSVQDGAQLWGRTLDKKFTDIFAAQDLISENVAAALALELSGDEKKMLRKHDTQNTEAYRAYLKGRFYWNKRTQDGARKAIESFREAIEKDPNYALAYVGLADAYGWERQLPGEVWARAIPLLMRALEIDDKLAEAHTSLAFAAGGFAWDWATAEREYRRAVELNPNYATAHHWFGEFLAFIGRFDEALVEIRRAQEIDPLSLPISRDVAEILFYARQYDQAKEQCLKAIEMDTNFGGAHYQLGNIYAREGQYPLAIAEFQKAGQNGDTVETEAQIAYVQALSGNRSAAQKTLNKLIEQANHSYVPPGHIAAIYIGLGDKDHAFEWLEKAYEKRSGMALLKVDPMDDSLRSDPRFTDLLRRVGLPQ